MKLLKTNSNHPDFQKLTRLFDDYLVEIDGDEKDFFAQYNQIYIDNVIVCYEDEIAVGCGAFKEYEPTVAEIKRMFVLPEKRGKGIASTVLNALEIWAKENGFQHAILETSNQLTNAISLYQKSGFEVIPNYGQYIDVESSVCMKKILK
ncbi:GNAT family N-acetyltransferase [Flavobacterium macrobrachii]|jgi:GNAT superfamily N-acetyltransferase|uniref:GNAT family N-acetyltransferase n=1 Tax=Flavobacterium macrobrachii TaxID=591204 RepID=A0ABS2CX87_9FLAO|nr:GNAT family N-acetyltransferase [Flavobacterium macrobrachii]MBM6499560.1 GNAT family N-acetyltransferase [Flavobacterium macrobrachii]